MSEIRMSTNTINRTDTTNFEFLKLEPDDWEVNKRFQEYYRRAQFIEGLYVKDNYQNTIKQAEKFIIDLLNDNTALKSMDTYATEDEVTDEKTKSLIWLKNIWLYLKQIAIECKQTIESEFTEPIAKDLYKPSERKLIYIQTADNSSGNWGVYSGYEKIGDATADPSKNSLDFQPNSEYLRNQAKRNRINDYMKTAGVPYKIDWAELAYKSVDKSWFRDYDVFNVLKRSGYKRSEKLDGNEWWKVNLEDAKKAIEAVKENREVIDGPKIDMDEIVLRNEQNEAVWKTIKVFETKNRMLWNAKMRFGKTLAAYQLIRESDYQRVLVLTHRPVVSDSWFDDFNKLKMDEKGYRYGSQKGESIESLLKSSKKFVYFASMQDLRGSSQVGGKYGEKNEFVFSTDWDLIVFDEAHEGTQTELAQNVENAVKNFGTKILELSGTPFNLIENYEENQVFTWDYVMEQEAKLRWNVEKPDVPNPYETLPKVNMFTFEMKNKTKYEDTSKAFNFREFFRLRDNQSDTNERGEKSFVHENDVKKFLDEITKESDTNFPYSTDKFRNELRHSLWLLPGVAEAKVLKSLMDKHSIFGKEYTVINIVDNNDSEDASEGDLDRVRSAITDKPWETKTITLTVRKLTAGVNIPEWTAVMFLNNTNSPTNYLQAAFRAQTPYSNEVQGQKKNCYIFDFAPDRALTVVTESVALNSGVGKRNTPEQKEKMSKLLNFLPILGMRDNKMKPFNVQQMLTQLKTVYAEKAVRSGFDDDSLYSDALLTIDPDAAELLKKLKGIVGKTGVSKRNKDVDINNQGLTDEEYERAEKAKKKPTRQRTPEEQEAIDKQNNARRERKNAISILRGISIRIPLMIYGMKVDLSKDIDIETFVKEADDASWEEFMPTGVTKEMFRKQAKYYDSEVFIEAGRIIRARAKSYDDLPYIERAKQIALLIGTFKNPDKETVLTPWRVVNMQLSSTIGGLSFFNEDFSECKEDVSDLNWVRQADTDEIYKDDKTFLEINSKTGLYPLYVTTSLLYHFIQRNKRGTNFDIQNEKVSEIIKNQIYVIAKTPMAKTITQRTLAGYKNWDSNIQYFPEITKKLKNDILAVKEDVLKRFNKGENMRFDVVVGNPPYHEQKGGTKNADIWQYFVFCANKMGRYVSMVHPARWIIPKKQMEKIKNQIIDSGLYYFDYFPDAKILFPNTLIDGGITITAYKKNYKEKIKYSQNGNYKGIFNPHEKFFINLFEEEIFGKLNPGIFGGGSMNDRVLGNLGSLGGSEFGYSKTKHILYLKSSSKELESPVRIWANNDYGKGSRFNWYYIEESILNNSPKALFENRKVMLDKKGHAITERKANIINNEPKIVDKKVIASGDVFFIIPENDNDYELKLISSMFKTKTVRFLMSITQKDLYVRGLENIPDYTYFIDMLNGKLFTDEWFYEKFDFSLELINHIETVISAK